MFDGSRRFKGRYRHIYIYRGLDMHLGLQEVEAFRILDNRYMKVERL
jgi:hypothetical protein